MKRSNPHFDSIKVALESLGAMLNVALPSLDADETTDDSAAARKLLLEVLMFKQRMV